MNTVDEVLDYAIGQEEEAAAFYASLAQRAEKAGMKDVLMDFSHEEQRHKERLLAVKQGEHELTPEQNVVDLKITDYLVDVEPSDDMSYQDALIIAMKREKSSFRLYKDLASKTDNADVKAMLLELANEEAKHKLFFESQYDDRVLSDN